MRRSWLLSVMALALAAAGGCASRKPTLLPPPVLLQRGSLAIARGLKTVSAELPAGFVADPGYPPVWLRQGAEVGVAGRAAGKSVMIGMRAPAYVQQRILAEDFGVAAPHGQLLDLAPSPDGLAIATAVRGHDEVAVMLQNILGEADAYTLAAIEGSFGGAQLTWLDPFTLVVALHPAAFTGGVDQGVAGARAGFYAIAAGGPPGIRELRRISCRPSHLSFSPGGSTVISEGDEDARPALIDLDAETCRPLGVHDPLQVLAWAPDSHAMLYQARGESAVPGIFRYDIASRRSVLIAISSGAAAYASDGTIVALGNSWLTWGRAAAAPDQPLNLQVALWRQGQEEITINPVGVATTASLLGRSRMVFSRISDDGVIDIVARGGEGLRRELIEYSYPARATIPLATVARDAPLAMSWSPDGKALAIVDGGVAPNVMTVIMPPR